MFSHNKCLNKLAIASAFATLSVCTFAAPAAKPEPTLIPRDGCESFSNPSNGRYAGHWIYLKETGNKPITFNEKSHRNFCCLWQLAAFSGGNAYRDKPLPVKEIGGEDKPISNDALAAIDATLASARKNGVTILIRLGYTSEEVFGSEPTKFETMLMHQEQVGKIISKYPDVVTSIECGMLGPWAEMHSTNYNKPEHIRGIVKKWIEVTPSTVAILCRAPNHILDFTGLANTDAFFAKREKIPGEERVGMYNDGYLGTDWDYGTWSGGKRGFTRAQGVSYLETRAEVPYGGECAYVDLNGARSVKLLMPDKYNIVHEFYRTHLSYLRNITQNISLIQHLDSLIFDQKTYAFDGMPDLKEYEGKSIRKLIEDHMGYRYVVRSVKMPPKVSRGRIMSVDFEIENTGFSQAHLPAEAEIIFTQGNKNIAVPAKLSSSVLDWKSMTKTKITVKVKTPKEIIPGDVDVSLRLRMMMDDEKIEDLPRRPIRFANEGMWKDDIRANKLGTYKAR